MKQFNQRKRLLIDKEFQLKYIFIPVLSIILNSIFFLCVIWFIINNLLQEIKEIEISSYTYIIALILAIIAINLGTALYFGLLASNHFVGPLFRLKKSINSLIDGSYGNKISFREGDFKFRLAQVYNDLSLALHQRVEDDLAFADKLKDKIRSINVESAGKLPIQLKELELEIDNFKKIKSQYIEK